MPENIFSYKGLCLENSNKPINLVFVRKVKNSFICRIENIITRNEAEKLIDFWEDQTNLPVTDVIRFGSKKLITAIKYFN